MIELPTRPAFSATVVCVGSRWRIVAGGELDLRSGRDLLEVAGILAGAGVEVVDFDLADVTFIDTAGWRAVERAIALFAEHGTRSALAATSRPVERLLDALAGTPTAR